MSRRVSLILSLVFALICLWLAGAYHRSVVQSGVARNAARYSARELAHVSPDSLNGRMVRVEGTIRCDRPLTSEYTKRPAVWYRNMVQVERDKHMRNGMNSTSTTDQADMTWFSIYDGTGYVLVGPGNADVSGAEVVYAGPDRRSASSYPWERRSVKEWVLSPKGHVVVIGKFSKIGGQSVIHDPDTDPQQWRGQGSGQLFGDSNGGYHPLHSNGCFFITRSDQEMQAAEASGRLALVLGTALIGGASVVCFLTFLGVGAFGRLIKSPITTH